MLEERTPTSGGERTCTCASGGVGDALGEARKLSLQRLRNARQRRQPRLVLAELNCPLRTVHAREQSQRFSGDAGEVIDVQSAWRRHEADWRLLGTRASLAARQRFTVRQSAARKDVLEHARILAKAGPEELARGVLSKPAAGMMGGVGVR